MQANPAYLPIEMSYNSQERQYLNVMMAPPDTDVAEDHTKMQASPLRWATSDKRANTLCQVEVCVVLGAVDV